MTMKGKPWSHTAPRFSPERVAAMAQADLALARRIVANPRSYSTLQLIWSKRMIARFTPGSAERIIKRV